MHGRMTHWETDALAGQKNATRGKAGVSLFVEGSVLTVPLELAEEMSSFLFLRGRCDPCCVGAMLSEFPQSGLSWHVVVKLSSAVQVTDPVHFYEE